MARRFRFQLETLLRVRRLREREAQRKVAAQQAEIARLDQLNRRSWEEISARQAELLAAQRSGTLDPVALSRGRAWVAHLRRTIAQREALKREMTVRLESLRAEWLEARKQTRILEKLRERRWLAYRKDRDRREQAATDELARQLQFYGRPDEPCPASAGEVGR